MSYLTYTKNNGKCIGATRGGCFGSLAPPKSKLAPPKKSFKNLKKKLKIYRITINYNTIDHYQVSQLINTYKWNVIILFNTIIYL